MSERLVSFQLLLDWVIFNRLLLCVADLSSELEDEADRHDDSMTALPSETDSQTKDLSEKERDDVDDSQKNSDPKPTDKDEVSAADVVSNEKTDSAEQPAAIASIQVTVGNCHSVFENRKNIQYF